MVVVVDVVTAFFSLIFSSPPFLSLEGVNEARPTTADWKAMNKTLSFVTYLLECYFIFLFLPNPQKIYNSSPNLLALFKKSDMTGRQTGKLKSRNQFHRVASAKLPRLEQTKPSGKYISNHISCPFIFINYV